MTIPFAAIISLGVSTASGIAQSVSDFKDTKRQIAQERKNIDRERTEIAVLSSEKARQRSEEYRGAVADIDAVAAYGNIRGTSVTMAKAEVARDTSLNDKFEFRALGETLQTLTERKQGLDALEKRSKVNLGLSVLTSLGGAGAQAAKVGGAAISDVRVSQSINSSLNAQYKDMIDRGISAEAAKAAVDKVAQGQGVQWHPL